MELRRTGWLQTVERDPFSQILISGLAVVAVFLAASDGTGTPRWLELDPALSGLCFALAFQRVRRAREVEEASSHAWDEVTTVWGHRAEGLDRVLEGTYQLGLHVLPFSAISVTVFLPVLLVTELSTIGHQLLFLWSHRRYFAERGYVHEPNTEVRQLFAWRLRVLAQRVVGAGLLAAVAWSFELSWRWPVLAIGLSLALLGAIAIEPFVAPRREGAATPQTTYVQEARPETLSRADGMRLADIFRRAFPDAETSAADLIARTGTDGHRLLVARHGDDPVGLLSYQTCADGVTFLWWIATDERFQRRGVARHLLATALQETGNPSLILFEVDLLSAHGEMRAARRGLLEALDARRIEGLRWSTGAVPSTYQIFHVPTATEPSSRADDVRSALARMARFSLRQDPRARDLALEAVATLDLRSALSR